MDAFVLLVRVLQILVGGQMHMTKMAWITQKLIGLYPEQHLVIGELVQVLLLSLVILGDQALP